MLTILVYRYIYIMGLKKKHVPRSYTGRMDLGCKLCFYQAISEKLSEPVNGKHNRYQSVMQITNGNP